jgi:UDP-N-acetylglucosamine acyltransferase
MNQIHPTAVIGSDVKIGTGNTVGPYAVILGNTEIGDDNWIGPHVVIGSPAQIRGGEHPTLWDGISNRAGVQIGSRNVIREFSTVHAGSVVTTCVGDDCYIMTKAHVPHDCVIGNGVTLSNSVDLGGHIVILDGANVGLGSVVHQRLVIGERAMVGMGSVVTKNIPPYATAFGNPAVVRSANKVGMDRAGLSPKLIDDVAAALTTGDMERLSVLVPEKMADFDQAIAVTRGNH